MRIKHTLENPLDSKLEVNWFKVVWFVGFAAIILSLGLVIGASLGSPYQPTYITPAVKSVSFNSFSQNKSKDGVLNLGLTGSNLNQYGPYSTISISLSSVEVENSKNHWVAIPVKNNLVELSSYISTPNQTNIYYLSKVNLPYGKYLGIKLYFSDVNFTLSNGQNINIPLYNTRVNIPKKFDIISSKNTYIAPVFNLGSMVESIGGEYSFSPNILQTNLDY
jgi:hypothetical protein